MRFRAWVSAENLSVVENHVTQLMPKLLSTADGELDQSLDAAVHILRAGGLVAFPTETVYGLGGDARNEQAVRRIFEVKGRPASHPLIVHLASGDELDEWGVDISDAARRLAKACWPGPLTLVVNRSSIVNPAITGGADTVALRVPSHRVAQALLSRFGPLAAPSANRFTKVSPTTAAHVADDLGEAVAAILDGGPSPVGIESTIVDCSKQQPVLLRPGAYSAEVLANLTGVPILHQGNSKTPSPGQHALHYSPRAKVVVCVPEYLRECVATHRDVVSRLIVLAWQAPPEDLTGISWWQFPQDLNQTAFELYARLREIDRQGFELAIIELPPESGIGAAIADRLRRAAGSSSFREKNR